MAARCLKVRRYIKMIIISLEYDLQRLFCGGSIVSWNITITDVQKNVMVTKERPVYI